MNENIESIRKILLENVHPSYQTTDKSEVYVRCPFCGDSKKDSSSAHLYISMKPPFLYHCKKCDSRGALNPELLRDLQVFNNDISLHILEANKMLQNKKIDFINIKKKKIEIPEEPDSFTEAKAKYFNNRFKKEFSNEYLVKKFRAVLNNTEFFKKNYIYVSQYDRFDFNNSIGFVSSDNSCAIFRDTTGQQEKRYYNLILDKSNPYASKIYNIAAGIDVLSEEMNLVVAEGIFDIIGVYEHFYKGKVDESKYIFAAVCGKDYNAVINKYIRMGFLNLKVTVFSDADINIEYYKNMFSKNKFIKGNQIEIFYNTIGKDYGVPFEQIKLSKAII